MIALLFGIHVILCVLMIMLVLLQQGKGADAGAVTSSSNSSSLFGPLGTGNPVSRLTTWLAIAFMLSSIVLVKYYNSISTRQSITGQSSQVDVLEGSSFAVEQKDSQNSAAVVANTEENLVDTNAASETAKKEEQEVEAPKAE